MGSSRVSGCGGIFRNCRACVKGCFAIPLGQVFAFETELLAASLAINFAWKYGWHRIWLKSDCSYVIQLLSSCSEMVPWRICQAWQRFIFQISQLDFQVFHIFTEGIMLQMRFLSMLWSFNLILSGSPARRSVLIY
ncbi:hypothetical protein Dsin_002473 [Dipteronia sinensis]|uniref:RNase H type-1 domain-containing protein n=1 Tax=Dipteronia sinensis TaxID=43782 RepID=A0AAE0B762_9ROSI|nr:hypothetical protein Dsin_002473 [Dipteronia sinensis]